MEVLPVWQQARDRSLRHRLHPKQGQRAQLVYPLDDEGLPWLHMGEGKEMKTVIEMAEEAGFGGYFYEAKSMFERFAELVRADALAQQALDKKAENARELGLDYEPAPMLIGNTVFPSKAQLAEFFLKPPAQRTWVGLTDKEAMQICVDCGCLSEDWLTLLDAIEAKLKEKNT